MLTNLWTNNKCVPPPTRRFDKEDKAARRAIYIRRVCIYIMRTPDELERQISKATEIFIWNTLRAEFLKMSLGIYLICMLYDT